MQVQNRVVDFVRRAMMARNGADYDCKRCGDRIVVAASIEYEKRDEDCLRQHPECEAK